jgi:hypothetical protein
VLLDVNVTNLRSLPLFSDPKLREHELLSPNPVSTQCKATNQIQPISDQPFCTVTVSSGRKLTPWFKLACLYLRR